MKTIIVDDEKLMLMRFLRLSKGIPGIDIVGEFESSEQAIEYARNNHVELAFLDIEMPIINGIALAGKLRAVRPDILIVFVTAYDKYIVDFNQIGGDYYIIKPYKRETLEMVMKKIDLLAQRQQKELYIQTFGNFTVLKNGIPLPLRGRAKEILALVVTKRGREISNSDIYSTLWEGREYSNEHMSVFYNALRRLKQTLRNASCEHLIISTAHGQMINTKCFDCDYYFWQDDNMNKSNPFYGEFMSEYSWGENILATILNGAALY